MKYIRTKDGRIITFVPKEKYENDKATFDWFVANYCGGGINVLKIADTIEELCDEFVVIYEESKKFTKPFTSAYCDISDVLKEHDLSECEIYGAIWTEKGLIYVAKMNEKGELETI